MDLLLEMLRIRVDRALYNLNLVEVVPARNKEDGTR